MTKCYWCQQSTQDPEFWEDPQNMQLDSRAYRKVGGVKLDARGEPLKPPAPTIAMCPPCAKLWRDSGDL